MINKKDLLRCGTCGSETIRLYHLEDDGYFLAECTKCKDISKIVLNASLSIEWGDNSEGILSKF